MSTVEILRRATDIAAALAPLDHLPPFNSLGVSEKEVTLNLTTTYDPWEKLLPLTQWAYAFGASVDISLSHYGGSGWVNTRFELAGHKVRICEIINTSHAYELGAALRRPLSLDGPITVSAKQMQQFIAEHAKTPVPK